MAFNGPDIGDMQHRVQVQRRDSTLDAFGQPSQAWSTLFTVWAAVEDISGKELLASLAIQSEVSTHIIIRYRNDFTVADRINWGGVIFNINAIVDPTGRKRALHLLCTRNLNQG